MIHSKNDQFELHHNDCKAAMKVLIEEGVQVDSIVCDPPYELGFMGKKWDKTGIANDIEVWELCLKLLKPGGHLIAFSGTRTYHRMATPIEDCGLEVRDMFHWIYGSGFPKSHNIGKAVDKLQGNERMVVGRNPNSRENSTKDNTLYESGAVGKTAVNTIGFSEWEGYGTAVKPGHEPAVFARKPLEKGLTIAQNVLKHRTGAINIDGNRVGDEVIKINKLNGGASPFGAYDSNGYEEHQEKGRFPADVMHDGSDEVEEVFPDSKGAGGSVPNVKVTGYGDKIGKGTNEYFGGERKVFDSGEGSASRFFFKAEHTQEPGHEPAILARKPLEKGLTIAQNVLKHRTGAINIDDNRVGDEERTYDLTMTSGNFETTGGGKNVKQGSATVSGRFPADVIHDGSNEVEEVFPHTKSGKMGPNHTRHTDGSPNGIYSKFDENHPLKETIGDEGSASRFFFKVEPTMQDMNFYCGKAGKKERNFGLDDFETKEFRGGGGRVDQGYEENEEGARLKNAAGKYGAVKAAKKNNHPTVKPVKLMEHLVRLVTPPTGIVLDPFMGSGSTGIAAVTNGFKFIGIDMSAEYCDLSHARIAAWAEKEDIKITGVSREPEALASLPADGCVASAEDPQTVFDLDQVIDAITEMTLEYPTDIMKFIKQCKSDTDRLRLLCHALPYLRYQLEEGCVAPYDYSFLSDIREILAEVRSLTAAVVGKEKTELFESMWEDCRLEE